jgi:6-phosphogluconolactonase (cycloisomerase 2 family)
MTSKQVFVLTAALLAAACEPGSQPLSPEPDWNVAATAGAANVDLGAVYLASNDAGGNEILVFSRDANGSLTSTGSVPTGGVGTSDGLGSQLAIAFTGDHRRLYVVNAGSDDITGFDVARRSLAAIGGPIPSGGDLPISLTVNGDLLYVLNAGSGGNISGFRIGATGALTPIPGSTRSLSGANTGPAQIAFTPGGRVLVVTEKNTSTITTYVVEADGRAGAPQVRASAGQTPFGFNFNARGDLVVSEAGGIGDGLSTASSYRVGHDGVLTLVSGPVPTTQAAACWIAIGQNGRFAYTTNTGSGTVSQLAIGVGAALALENPVAGVTGPGSLPQDADFTPGGRFLYVRNAGGSVSGFRVESDGALIPLGSFGPIPTFASGIAAR